MRFPALALGCAMLCLLATAPAAIGAKGVASQAVKQDPGAVLDYWTPQRMRSAVPLEGPIGDGGIPESRARQMPHAPEEDLGDADLQPLALGRSRSSASLAWTLAVARFRRRYLESALGYAWALLRPLAFFAVLYLVFTNIGRFDQGVPHYGLYLLTAIVLWVMFAESTSSSLGSVVRNGRLLRSVPLPPIVLPLSVVISSLLDLAMNLVAVAVFVAASGIEPRWTWLELPAIVGLVAVFATGTGMLLAALFVRLRDIDQVWTVARQALLYGSPIVYVATAYPESVQGVLTAMPLAAAFTEARHALIDPGAPSASELLGGFPTVMVPVAIAVGTLALGILAVSRLGPSAAERA